MLCEWNRTLDERIGDFLRPHATALYERYSFEEELLGDLDRSLIADKEVLSTNLHFLPRGCTIKGRQSSPFILKPRFSFFFLLIIQRDDIPDANQTSSCLSSFLLQLFAILLELLFQLSSR